MSSEHLTLVEIGRQQLIRVGRPPRIEMAGWRYGPRLPNQRRMGFFKSLFDGLPPPPVHGYRPYALGRADPPAHWVLSPFQEAAWALTTVFTAVPLASECPSHGGPLALNPWVFHTLRLVESGSAALAVPCAICGDDVVLDLRAARPALRLGLSVVDGSPFGSGRAGQGALQLDRVGGAREWVRKLASDSTTVGEMDRMERATLAMALDEDAEMEALENEWQAEEEIAEIMDGELTDVPGFDAFRQSVLAAHRGAGF